MADGDDTREPKPPNPDDPNDNGGGDPAQPAGEGAQPAADDAQPRGENVPRGKDYERLYETHIGRLIATARDDFGIEEEAAVELAHTIMMSLLHASPRVSNIPRWLDGAIALASEALVLRGVVVDWGRQSPVPPDLILPNGVAWRDVVEQLTPRFRRLLELRYVDGQTIADMADMLGITASHVERLLERCLRQTERYAVRRSGASG